MSMSTNTVHIGTYSNMISLILQQLKNNVNR